MRREERVTVQGPVKKQQPDGMSHRGGGGASPTAARSARIPPKHRPRASSPSPKRVPLSLSRSLSLSLARSLALSLSLCHSLPLSLPLSLTLTLTLALALSLSLPLPLSPPLSLSLTLTLALALALSLSLPLPPPPPLSLPLSQDTKDDPLAQWKAAWDHLGGEKAVAAGLVGRYGAALECLERYLDEHPSDPVALWLESAVRCRWEEAEQAPALTGQCGRVPFLLQYSAPKAAPEDAAAAAYGTPRAEAGGPNASTASGGGAGYVPRSPAAGRTRVHGPQSRRSMASPGHAARCSSVVSLSSVGSVIHSDLRLFRVLSDNIQMLLASGSDPVVVLDHQETLHYWNARAEQMFGWTAAEAVGQKLDLILPPALRGGRHAAHVARYLAAGRPLDAARMTGVTGVHKSGAEVAVDVAVHVCTSGVAEKTLFVGFFRDRGAAGAPGGAFPAEVAAQLRADPRAVVAARYDCATALFADLAGFPRAAAALEAEAAVRARSLVIAAFDVLCQQHSVTKVKTLGDMYVAVCGAPAAVKGHAEKAVDCALDLIDKGDALGAGDRPLAVRVGVSTGAVVAGVVGGQRRSYDVWGAAVNVASRLMSHGQPRRLQISQSTHERLLNKANYALTPAEVAVEGAAPVRAYFVERKKWAMG